MKKTFFDLTLASKQRKRIRSFLILIALMLSSSVLFAQSPLEANGKLSVSGINLVNESGTPVQLRGMSAQGIQWFTEDYNFNTLSLLVNKWGIDIFRLPISPTLKNEGYATTLGYDGNPAFWKNYIDNRVDECGALGIYCIIDWHILATNNIPDPSDPYVLPLAKEFFDYMSSKHAGKKQVIYEICNEPSVNWGGTNGVKSYAETIIPIIRKNDTDAVIIVGTPFYSSDLASVVADPLTGDTAKNVMYALHFYAGSTAHNEYRNRLTTALSNGLPVFVSEWGTTGSDGKTGMDYPNSQTWLDLLKANNISWCNWSYSDADEGSAALKLGSGALVTDGGTGIGWDNWDNTTDEGDHVKEYISNPADAWTSTGSWKPAVGLYSPFNGFYSLTGNMILLKAEGISRYDNISSIDFFANNNNIGTGYPDPINIPGGIKFPFSMGWVPTTAGDYVITAIATNNKGVTSSLSLPITIHVIDIMPAETAYPNDVPLPIPGTIQCSNFDKGGEMVAYHDLDAIHKGPYAGSDRQDEGVDVEKSGSAADVGYVISGEWLNYTVNVQQSGLYKLTMTTASKIPEPGMFHVESNDHQITNYIKIPYTGDWTKYEVTATVYNIPLSAGVQVLKLYTDIGNFNYLTAQLDYQGGSVHTITTTSQSGGGNVNPGGGDSPTLPCGTFTIADGDMMSIFAWPYPGNVVADVEVDGVPINIDPSTGGSSIVQFLNVTANHTVNVNFKKGNTINATAGPNGAIDPIGATTLYTGDTMTYTITPDTGYKVSEILVDGSPVDPALTYTFNNISEDHTIAVSFAIADYTITASSGPNGSIDPSGDITLNQGSNQTFTFTPSQGYKVSEVLVDGSPVDISLTFTFNDINADHTIAVSFAIADYTITASAGPNGSIDPSGDITLNPGASQTYTITPAEGYKISEVLIDGSPVDLALSYVFNDISADHTIAVSFDILTYTITASAGSNGSIDPIGATTLNYGASQTYTVTPAEGYKISEVLVDGSSVDLALSYLFSDINADHTIEVSFDAVCSLLTLYNAPGTVALPSLNTSYNYIYVLGDHALITNITKFTINWNLANNGLYQFSINTSNGSPDWYVDLRSDMTYSLSGASPSITITGSNAGLDGNYYAIMDNNNFVLVEQSGAYAIYFSNSTATPQGCDDASVEPATDLLTLFEVPRSSALQAFNATYSNVYVIVGDGSNLKSASFRQAYVTETVGPDLSNVTCFVVNWDLSNKQLNQFSFQTNNGIPEWWLNLIPKMTHTFASESPSCRISGSGIAGLDGDYYVNFIDGNFVLVSTSGNYAIYGSNSSTPPSGARFKNTFNENGNETPEESFTMFPNPVSRNSAITINLSSIAPDGALITITDLSGKIIYSNILREVNSSLNLGDMIASGLYIVKITNGNSQLFQNLVVK